MEFISPFISVTALLLSLFTLWFSVLRRGDVRSTHPSFIAFKYDFVDEPVPQAKIVMRALLFSSGKRGQVVESLFLRVKEGSRQAEFSYWGYGDKEHVRGSGLFVPENGVVTYHRFNPINASEFFLFSAGRYSLSLVAKLVGRKRLVTLWTDYLDVPENVFDATFDQDTEIHFNWSVEKNLYLHSVKRRSSLS